MADPGDHHYDVEQQGSLAVYTDNQDHMVVTAGQREDHRRNTFEERFVKSSPPRDHICNVQSSTPSTIGMEGCTQDDPRKPQCFVSESVKKVSSVFSTASQVETENPRNVRPAHEDLSKNDGSVTTVQAPPLRKSLVEIHSSLNPDTQEEGDVMDSVNKPSPLQAHTRTSSMNYNNVNISNPKLGSTALPRWVTGSLEATLQADHLSSQCPNLQIQKRIQKEKMCTACASTDLRTVQNVSSAASVDDRSSSVGRSINYFTLAAASSCPISSVGPTTPVLTAELDQHSFTSGNILLSSATEASEMDATPEKYSFAERLVNANSSEELSLVNFADKQPPPASIGLKHLEKNNDVYKFLFPTLETVAPNGKPTNRVESIVRKEKLPSVLYSEKVLLDEGREPQKTCLIGNDDENVILQQVISGNLSNDQPEVIKLPLMSKDNDLSHLEDIEYENSALHTSPSPSGKCSRTDHVNEPNRNPVSARQNRTGGVERRHGRACRDSVPDGTGNCVGNHDHKVAKDIEKKNILKSERLKSASVSKRAISCLPESSSVGLHNERNTVVLDDQQSFLNAVEFTTDGHRFHQQSHTLSDPTMAVTSNVDNIVYVFSRSLQDLNMSVEPPSPTEEVVFNIGNTSEIKTATLKTYGAKTSCHRKAIQKQSSLLQGEINSQTSSESNLTNLSSDSTSLLDEPTFSDRTNHVHDVQPNIAERKTNCKKAEVAVKRLRDQQVETDSCIQGNRDAMHFGSSDINPYAHPWQQDEHFRVGWKQYVFGSASDVSCKQAPQGLDDHTVMRCSSVDNGLNAQRSPFHSHLSSYVNARVMSSPLSSIEDLQGWDDAKEDCEPTYSSDGVKHYYPLSSEVIITEPEDGVFQFESTSRSPGNNSMLVDEIVLLYPSESESSEKPEKATREQGTQTATKTRSKRLNKHQKSSTDVSKAKPELSRRSFQRPTSVTSMRDLSVHLSQLLHNTSELLGNLSQQHHLDIHPTADHNPGMFPEKSFGTCRTDISTQTTSDQSIQTDFSSAPETTEQDSQAQQKHENDNANAQEGNGNGKFRGSGRADVSQEEETVTLLLHDERIPQHMNFKIQSMPNLHHSKGLQESFVTRTSLRCSTPLLEDFQQPLARSHQDQSLFNPTVSPVASPSPSPELSKASHTVVSSSASSTPDLSGARTQGRNADDQSDRKQCYEKTLLVDRASSPILTLRASPSTSKSLCSIGESLKPQNSVVKSSSRQKKQSSDSRRCGVSDSSMDTSSQTDTDSQCSSSQGSKKLFTQSVFSHRKVTKDVLEEEVSDKTELKHRAGCDNNGSKAAPYKKSSHADASFNTFGQGEREKCDQYAIRNIPTEQSLPGKDARTNGRNILPETKHDAGSSDTLFFKNYPAHVAYPRIKSSSVENFLHTHQEVNNCFDLQPTHSCVDASFRTDVEKRSLERVHNGSFWKNANSDPLSPSGTSDMTVLLPDDDTASVAASECNTDVLLSENPSLAVNQRPRSYSLRDLPQHNKFSNWSGVQPNPASPLSLASSADDFHGERQRKQIRHTGTETDATSHLCQSKAMEIEVLRRERAQIMSGVHLDLNQHPLTVELAEAKLSYGIGETDALLRKLQSGTGAAVNPVSMKQQLYERHMKSIEALRKEREERLQSFRRSRSLSPQKHLSLSQPSVATPRDLDLPSRRREYLQQLRKDVVDNTRVQEPKRWTAQCPSEIELLLRDYQRAREEAKTEIARARDKLRERAEQEKQRLHQQMVSHLLKEESKMKTLLSTSTLCTGSSLSLSSGPTSGYDSSNTTTYTASKYSTQVGQVVPRSMEDAKRNLRGRSSVRNSQVYVSDKSSNNSDSETLSAGAESQGGPPPPRSGGSSPLSTRGISLSFKSIPSSPPTSYKDLAKHTLANATAEIMAACSYNLGNLFRCQATAGWKYQCTEKEVMVYHKAYPSATRHGFLGAGVIARPLHSVWCMVKDPSKRHLYDKTITTVQVHKKVSSDIQLVYVMSDMALCYLKQPRDFCCISVQSKEEKWFTVAFQSVYDESMPRPSKDTVRGEILPSAWIMQPDTVNGKDITRVIYSVEVELGAPALPARLLGSIAKRQPLAIASLANFLSS